jgi:hypothetical protein
MTSPVSSRLVELLGDGDELGEVLDARLVLRVELARSSAR